MTDNSSNAPYTTQSEMEFINKLGTCSDQHTVDRFELLRRYERACKKRIRWDRIDGVESMAHLNQMARD